MTKALSALPLLLCAVSALHLATGCRRGEVEPGGSAVVAGSRLNAFFPEDDGRDDVVFVSEKDGFSQAALRRDGNEIGTLSISDAGPGSGVADKFAASAETVAGHPSLSRGAKGTAVLVGGRFQVQARAKEDSFDEVERKKWLSRFDLAGLEALAGK